MPPPVSVRHSEYSMLFSADDDLGKPSGTLIDIALRSAKDAVEIDLTDIAQRTEQGHFLNVWPGEHYKLIASLIKTLKPKVIIEIGTEKGLSALCIKKYMPADSKLVTFDIISWKKYPGGAYLEQKDFADGNFIQYTDDLSTKEGVLKHIDLLKNADLIFVDAAKDGAQEQRFIDNFRTIQFNRPPFIIFDDIRLWNMLKIWREISLPKLDVTSFGHWSGTGLVEWKNQ